jgi:hypothetical protein
MMAREFLQTAKQRREPAPKLDAPQTTSQSLLRSTATEGEWIELCRALLNLNAFVYVD